MRHAAVHGAVTALRQALAGLVLGPRGASIGEQGERSATVGEESDSKEGETQQQQEQNGSQPAADPTAEEAVLGCLTAGGQVLRCKEALIAGPRALG